MNQDGTHPVDVVDLAKRFAASHAERARVNKEFDKLKAEVETIFIARNVPSIVVGDRLVHLSSRDRPIPKDGCEEALLDAFESDDETKHLVSRTLRGITEWMGELPTDERTLETIFPPHVKDLICVVSKVSACVRRRTKKTKGGA